MLTYICIFKILVMKIKKVLHEREQKMELLINKFRIFILILITIADLMSLLFVTKLPLNIIEKLGFYEIILTIFALISVTGIYFFAKNKKYFSFLKYYTVSYDLLITFAFGYMFLVVFDLPIPINPLSFALLITIFFLFFNMLSILRINKKVIIYGGVLTLFLNLFMLYHAQSTLMPIIYTSLFIIAFTIYNFWVSDHIVNFIIVNKKLDSAYSEIELVNKDILKRNNEITIQRDEIKEQKVQIEKHTNKITQSIEYAKLIQQAVHPENNFLNEYFQESFIFFKPRDIVSGDFYWMKDIDNKIVIIASDCTGHGVPGAFMSMLGISFLNEIIPKNINKSAGKNLDLLREKIKKTLKQSGKREEQKDGMDLSLCIIDKQTNELEFAGAYNPLFLIRQKNDLNIYDSLKEFKVSEKENIELFEIPADKQPIAIYIKEKPFSTQKLLLQKNDKIYLFSDGYADQFNGQTGKKFMQRNFKRLLLNHLMNNLIF